MSRDQQANLDLEGRPEMSRDQQANLDLEGRPEMSRDQQANLDLEGRPEMSRDQQANLDLVGRPEMSRDQQAFDGESRGAHDLNADSLEMKESIDRSCDIADQCNSGPRDLDGQKDGLSVEGQDGVSACDAENVHIGKPRDEKEDRGVNNAYGKRESAHNCDAESGITSRNDAARWRSVRVIIGKLIASPLVGFWSNIRSSTRAPLVGTLLINMASNFLYMYLQSIPLHPEVFLLVARILVGIGSVLQAALVPIGHPGPVNTSWFHLDMYTAAGLLGALTSAANILLVIFAFKEVSVPDEPDDTAQENHDIHPTSPDYLAVIVTVVLYCLVLIIFAFIETVSTPLCMHMFGWNRADASLYVGITFGVAGVVSIATFIAIKFIAQWVDDRHLLIAGFVAQFIAVFCLLPWNKEGPSIYQKSTNESESESIEPVGCPSTYDWCHVTPGLNTWQFYLATFLLAVGYPTCNVMTYIIFSKILGQMKQGTWMGWLTASGALGKLIGPVIVGYMYHGFGPRITFSFIMGVIVLTVLGVGAFYTRLVPYNLRQGNETMENSEKNQAQLIWYSSNSLCSYDVSDKPSDDFD
ncbi:MFSD8-like protein [Mya arenaria]|uniref:MFSD8-like protein n=1 Tax=Mya arenaria TaxID=6604 RepID=A0ABY7FJK9_MYAAR|nr:MFSD8-like protein [Mya arenaria]